MKALGLVLLAGAALTLPAAGGSAGDPGITSDQILIGGTVPLSGPASPFGAVGPGANAYFKYVNAHGGVYGRKIKYLWRDDGYDPSRTLEQTRELVHVRKKKDADAEADPDADAGAPIADEGPPPAV